MSAAFQYGIANTDSSLKFPKFNGDPAKYREFKNNLCLALNAKGIVPPKIKGEPLFNIKMAHYASTQAERIPILVPTAQQLADGLALGDLPLDPPNLRMYLKDKAKCFSLESYGISFYWLNIEGEECLALAGPGYEKQNFTLIWWAFEDFYNQKTTPVLFNLAVQTMHFYRKAEGSKPMQSFDRFRALSTQF